MSKFLLGRLGEDRSLTSEMSGTTVSGTKLANLLEKMEEYRTHVARLGLRGIPEGLPARSAGPRHDRQDRFRRPEEGPGPRQVRPGLRRRKGRRPRRRGALRLGPRDLAQGQRGAAHGPHRRRLRLGLRIQAHQGDGQGDRRVPGWPLRRDARRGDREARDAARRRGRDLRIRQEGPPDQSVQGTRRDEPRATLGHDHEPRNAAAPPGGRRGRGRGERGVHRSSWEMPSSPGASSSSRTRSTCAISIFRALEFRISA